MSCTVLRSVRNGGRRPRLPDEELVVPAVPVQQESAELSPEDIERINLQFLSRTKDLEPGMEVKQLPQIGREFRDRFDARYYEPSKIWFEMNWLNRTKFSRKMLNVVPKKEDSKEVFQYKASALMAKPLDVGDLVLLKSHPSELSMCIDVPSSTKDPRYCFTTVDGSLKFGSRSLVLMRIPHSLPQEMSKMAALLVREAKHGFEPIGTIKNQANETLVLPVIARQLVTSCVTQRISKSAWDQLPVTIKKLELLHRRLQDSTGPVPVPFFDLVTMIQSLDITKAISNKDGEPYIRDVIQNSRTGSTSTIDSSCALATYWAIEAQQKNHLFGDIQISRALLSPVSVLILPFASQHLFYSELKEQLKSNGQEAIQEFSKLANKGKYTELTTRFPHIIQVLKGYAAGNLHNDEGIVSLIAAIFRKIDEFKDNDITRDACEKLLSRTLPQGTVENPIYANFTLGLPDSSARSRTQQQVYDLSKPASAQSTEKRHDFKDLRVYCIDSEEAHEIDDGVSIEDCGNGKYTLHIHIADPASLFPESESSEQSGINDEVLKVAAERCFTTYLPDAVSPMLPQTFTTVCDLGHQGQKTKTITFSVDILVKDGAIKIFFDSYKIRLGLVSNFPKVTYETVDRYLTEPNSVNEEILYDLKLMHKIAELLRESRIQKDGAIVFGSGFNQGLVAVSPVDQEISFFDQKESKSTLLVSELMILANSLAGRFFAEKEIPGIFRAYQPLTLRGQADQEYERMKKSVKKGILPTTKDINMLSSLLNSSFYCEYPTVHAMIGASQYLTVTSPLRRFPDIINHLQIHRVLRNLPLCFTEDALSKMLWHIQLRDAALKKASAHQASYWTLKYIKNLIRDTPTQRFDVTITSVPQLNVARCVLAKFPSARGVLKLKPSATNIPTVGDSVKGCKVSKIDCLDSLLELEL